MTSGLSASDLEPKQLVIHALGTNHAKYDETFEKVCERRAKGVEVPTPQTT